MSLAMLETDLVGAPGQPQMGLRLLAWEPTVTSVGTLVTGAFPDSYDFFNSADGSFNGAAIIVVNLCDGLTLATFGTGAVQSAYWLAGAAPGNPTVDGVTTFPGPRLLPKSSATL